MRMLTITDNDPQVGNTVSFNGVNKRHAVKQLRQYIAEKKDADLDIEIEPEYKSIRRLTFHAPEEHPAGGDKWEISIGENGVGEIEPFDDKEKAIERFIELCDEPGDHFTTDIDIDDLKVEGVRADKIEQMRSPPDHDATQKAAEAVVKVLDDCDYSREQVHAILKWAVYLSTQA